MIATTCASVPSSPTLPAKTTYGIPTASGAASSGQNTEIVPGNNWPATSARWIPSPCSITSCEVMPPLATTQAGRAASALADDRGTGPRTRCGRS